MPIRAQHYQGGTSLPVVWSDKGRLHIIKFGQINALHTLPAEDSWTLDIAELPCMCNGLFPSDWLENLHDALSRLHHIPHSHNRDKDSYLLAIFSILNCFTFDFHQIGTTAANLFKRAESYAKILQSPVSTCCFCTLVFPPYTVDLSKE